MTNFEDSIPKLAPLTPTEKLARHSADNAYAIRLRNAGTTLKAVLDDHHKACGARDIPHLYQTIEYLRRLERAAASGLLDGITLQ